MRNRDSESARGTFDSRQYRRVEVKRTLDKGREIAAPAGIDECLIHEDSRLLLVVVHTQTRKTLQKDHVVVVGRVAANVAKRLRSASLAL